MRASKLLVLHRDAGNGFTSWPFRRRIHSPGLRRRRARRDATPSGDVRQLGTWKTRHPELFREFGDGLTGPNSPYFTPRSDDHPKLENLTGWIEYDVMEPGHPMHSVARARIDGRVKYPRQEDYTWPSPYRSAWNPEARRFVSVTQHALDKGNMWPQGTREIPDEQKRWPRDTL
jgi:hypothetical protein